MTNKEETVKGRMPPTVAPERKLTKHGKSVHEATDILGRGVCTVSADVFKRCQDLAAQYKQEHPDGPDDVDVNTIIVAAVFKTHHGRIQAELENIGKAAVRKHGAMVACEAWYRVNLWIHQNNKGRMTFTVEHKEIPFVFQALVDYFQRFAQMKTVEAAEAPVGALKKNIEGAKMDDEGNPSDDEISLDIDDDDQDGDDDDQDGDDD